MSLEERIKEKIYGLEIAADIEDVIVKGLDHQYQTWKERRTKGEPYTDEEMPNVRLVREHIKAQSNATKYRQEAEDLRTLLMTWQEATNKK